MFPRRIENHQEESFYNLASAQEYAESVKRNSIRYQAFLKKLGSLKLLGRYLDVGAGTGNLAAMIVKDNPGVEITALEISPEMITVGENYLKNEGIENRVHFEKGDVLDVNCLDRLGEFDFIYSTFSLHHWKDPKQVIKNLLSILNNEGYLYLYDLRRVWWLYWIPNDNGFLKSIRAAYVRQEIEEMLCDLDEVEYQILDEFPFLHSILIRKVNMETR